ncbi:TlpA family protein disulfide reductase [Pedobacter arcticus]|uniref:TlpA family protein disulfide reductase n=1 Tax=Pedobacter arcticus TaxID=752140 RepID=UPI0029352D20|nr:TlpA disulfide reductase family protein [Pedobacter arcticus]
MTGEGGGLQLRSNPNSNDLSLPKNSALSVAVKVKNFLHCHCSKWRSGEFIQFAYCFLKAFMHPLRSSLVTFFGKKELAFPPAMRRGDFNSTNKSKNRDNRESSKKLLSNRLSLHPSARAYASLITMTGEGEGGRYKALGTPIRRKTRNSKLRPNLLMLLLMVVVIIGAGDKAKSQNRALQIGDTIPAEIWNTPLKVVNHPEGKTTIKLSDYKGKLIILDFWATWCVNCVKSFPEEDRLQKEFKDQIVILPVSTQKQSVISAFMQRDNPTKGTSLTVVTDDQLLSKTFKHQLMPHVVWIDGTGHFVASTAASYVQTEKIQQVLKSEKLNWTMKRDFLEFNKADALMAWVERGGAMPKMTGYSAFATHLLGVDPVSGLQSNEAEGHQRRYDINMTLGTFSVRASETKLPLLSKKQYRYEVKDINNYSCPVGTLYMDWKVKHTFCYEAVFPLSFNPAQIKQKMREDLKCYFGLEGKLEYLKVTAWLFDKVGTTTKQTAVADTQSLDNLIWEINEHHPELPIAIAETAIGNLQVPKMDDTPLNISNINKRLAGYGIELKVAEKEVPFFVLYEQNKGANKP